MNTSENNQSLKGDSEEINCSIKGSYENLKSTKENYFKYCNEISQVDDQIERLKKFKD